MHHLTLRKCIVAIGMIGGIALSGSAWASPVEHAVDTAGLVGPVALAYGDHTINSGLSSALEVDSYTFAGATGDSIRIALQALSFVDPSLVLRGPTGTILESATCNGVCSTFLNHVLPESGLYTFNVSDVGGNDSGNYHLHLDRYPPIDNWLGIAYSAQINEAIGHATDSDYYAFNGVAGTEVRLAVAANSFVDPVVEIWDPTGVLISNTSCNGVCSNIVDLSLTKSGVYKFGVADGGANDTGNYGLQVSCLFGACPSPLDAAPIPSPIPEPESYALLMAGLGVIGMVVRRRARRN